MSVFRVGDSVRWKHHGLWGSGLKVVTETGLESPTPAMPGEQVRVRIADGSLVRVRVADIELVPGAERGQEASAQTRVAKGKCPYCGRHVSVTKKLRIHAHQVRGTGRRCGGSGQAPS